MVVDEKQRINWPLEYGQHLYRALFGMTICFKSAEVAIHVIRFCAFVGSCVISDNRRPQIIVLRSGWWIDILSVDDIVLVQSLQTM